MAARVLIVSPSDLSPKLVHTVLWRDDIERVFAASAEEALPMARALQPGLVVVDAQAIPYAAQIIRQIRQDPETRTISLVALAGRARDGEALQKAGANLVLPASLNSAIFDRRIEELLEVPRRRDTRLPASFQVWSRTESASPLRQGLVLNLSVRGMLIETEEPLAMGTTVEIRLPLPGEPEPVVLMALAEREAPAPSGRFRTGVQFLILRDPARDRLRAFIEQGGS